MQDSDPQHVQQHGNGPPARTWIKPTITRTQLTSELLTWIDDNGSTVRLISTNAAEVGQRDD